jgi:hypothetical protein
LLACSNQGKELLAPGPEEELSADKKVLIKLQEGKVRRGPPSMKAATSTPAQACWTHVSHAEWQHEAAPMMHANKSKASSVLLSGL